MSGPDSYSMLYQRWVDACTTIEEQDTEIARLTQVLAEARREVDEQARLRRVAEDAIPRGIEVAKEFIRSEYGLRMDSSVELATCLSNLLNLTTSQDGGGYCSICNCCHSPDSARCWGTRARNALTKWSNHQ